MRDAVLPCLVGSALAQNGAGLRSRLPRTRMSHLERLFGLYEGVRVWGLEPPVQIDSWVPWNSLNASSSTSLAMQIPSLYAAIRIHGLSGDAKKSEHLRERLRDEIMARDSTRGWIPLRIPMAEGKQTRRYYAAGWFSLLYKHMLGTVARPEQELLTDDGRCCAIGQEAALTAWNRVRILSSRALSGLWSSMRAQVDRSRRRS